MALATPYGVAAMAKLRVSGPRTRELIQTIFRRREWQARHVYFSPFWAKDGKTLDEVCWFFFEGHRSYTGEDSLEIDAHGNPLIIRRVLEDLEGRGCRLAEPGEFTRRAFLNHKIDLCQAEAVLDLIHAPHDEALAVASEQLSGNLSRKISDWRDRLLGLLASVELGIDFSSESEEEADAEPPIGEVLESLLEEMRELRAMQGAAERLRRGLQVVLIGEPNAGKSSLFNRLLRQERALVDAGAGTTRDFIGANWVCAGQILELIDTAGLRDPESDLERQGIEKSRALLEKADLVLLMAVNPGFGGQAFIESTLRKTEALSELLAKRGLSVPIEIDGGVNDQTAPLLAKAGASVLVSGSHLFGQTDYKAGVARLRSLAERAIRAE
jgi:tRNA modification GTPase